MRANYRKPGKIPLAAAWIAETQGPKLEGNAISNVSAFVECGGWGKHSVPPGQGTFRAIALARSALRVAGTKIH